MLDILEWTDLAKTNFPFFYLQIAIEKYSGFP